MPQRCDGPRRAQPHIEIDETETMQHLKSLGAAVMLALSAVAVAQGPAPGAEASTAQTQESAASGASDSAAPVDEGASWNRRRRVPPGGIDRRVKLLAAELGLDAAQQAGVRKVLVEQSEQTLKVWNNTSIAAPLRIKATQDIADRTAARIRALLNEQQRVKYMKPRPGDLAPGGSSAEMQQWIDATGRKP